METHAQTACVCRGNVKIEKLKNESFICQTSESSIAYINGVSEAMFFFTTTRPSLPKEGTKKDMSIKDWFKGSCSKAGALTRS